MSFSSCIEILTDTSYLIGAAFLLAALWSDKCQEFGRLLVSERSIGDFGQVIILGAWDFVMKSAALLLEGMSQARVMNLLYP